eukprot:scaffold2835_cov259-Pinguiococcus_pyrenoidosus.AAC.6
MKCHKIEPIPRNHYRACSTKLGHLTSIQCFSHVPASKSRHLVERSLTTRASPVSPVFRITSTSISWTLPGLSL